MTQVIVHAFPLAPPTRTGKPGAYGLYRSTATNSATGQRVPALGINEAAARRQARQEAAREWGELLAFLDAESKAIDAEERGEAERRDVEFDILGA